MRSLVSMGRTLEECAAAFRVAVEASRAAREKAHLLRQELAEAERVAGETEAACAILRNDLLVRATLGDNRPGSIIGRDATTGRMP